MLCSCSVIDHFVEEMTESTLIQVYRGFNSLVRFDVNILQAVSIFQEKVGKRCRKSHKHYGGKKLLLNILDKHYILTVKYAVKKKHFNHFSIAAHTLRVSDF